MSTWSERERCGIGYGCTVMTYALSVRKCRGRKVVAELKVWGSVMINHRRSAESSGMVRTIVAARNQKEAAAIVGCSLHEFRGYWSQTGNAEEIAAGLKKPGVQLQATTSMGADFEATTT
jgi:hypothetical protein